MMSRASRERRTVSSSEEFMGKVPRIQRLPSSNSGMNSRPSNGKLPSVAAITPAKVANVSQRCRMQRCNCRR